MKKILLIGCGHMGNALLTKWFKSKNYSITVIDPIYYEVLKQKYKYKKILVKKTLNELTNFDKFEIIILATKPIDLSNALKELSIYKLNQNCALVSIVAGKKIKIFKQKFKYIKNFFRVMPNMPALIGEGMNCIVSNKNANKSKKNQIIELFNYSGKTIFMNNEDDIDMITAISGSGPGFVFNTIDAMEKAALKLGINKKIANTLVLETFKGSIHLLLDSNKSANELVKTIATKGGTTEAGLKIMQKYKFHKIFENLTRASYKKAKEQGK